jgi:hypothetical protein
VAREQVTVWPEAEQLQPVPVAETKVQPDGSVSVTTTVLAIAGPPLRGVIVKVAFSPAMTGLGDTALLSMRTSAPGSTVVVAVAVLLLLSGSAVAPAAGLRVALLVTNPVEASMRATMVIGGALAPTAKEPVRLQVTKPTTWEQLHPVPEADTKVDDPGRFSVRTRLPEAFGPSLKAVSV